MSERVNLVMERKRFEELEADKSKSRKFETVLSDVRVVPRSVRVRNDYVQLTVLPEEVITQLKKMIEKESRITRSLLTIHCDTQIREIKPLFLGGLLRDVVREELEGGVGKRRRLEALWNGLPGAEQTKFLVWVGAQKERER